MGQEPGEGKMPDPSSPGEGAAQGKGGAGHPEGHTPGLRSICGQLARKETTCEGVNYTGF